MLQKYSIDYYFWAEIWTYFSTFFIFFSPFQGVKQDRKGYFLHILLFWFHRWHNEDNINQKLNGKEKMHDDWGEGDSASNYLIQERCKNALWSDVWREIMGLFTFSQTLVFLYCFVCSTSSVTIKITLDSKMKQMKMVNISRGWTLGPPPCHVKEPQKTGNKSWTTCGLKWKKSFLQMTQHHSLLSLWKCKIYCTKVRIKTVKPPRLDAHGVIILVNNHVKTLTCCT